MAPRKNAKPVDMDGQKTITSFFKPGPKPKQTRNVATREATGIHDIPLQNPKWEKGWEKGTAEGRKNGLNQKPLAALADITRFILGGEYLLRHGGVKVGDAESAARQTEEIRNENEDPQMLGCLESCTTTEHNGEASQEKGSTAETGVNEIIASFCRLSAEQRDSSHPPLVASSCINGDLAKGDVNQKCITVPSKVKQIPTLLSERSKWDRKPKRPYSP